MLRSILCLPILSTLFVVYQEHRQGDPVSPSFFREMSKKGGDQNSKFGPEFS